jgi:hypothetical protein
LAKTPTIVFEIYRTYRQNLDVNAGMVSELGNDRFLLRALQLGINLMQQFYPIAM